MTLQKVIAMAKGLGVKVDTTERPGDLPCPFNVRLALRFPDTLIVDTEGLDSETIGESIHELGHLIMGMDVSEFDFLGWEFAVAVKFDLMDEWLEGLMDYSLGGSLPDFAGLSSEEADDLFENRVQTARDLGFLLGDEPRCLAGS